MVPARSHDGALGAGELVDDGLLGHKRRLVARQEVEFRNPRPAGGKDCDDKLERVVDRLLLHSMPCTFRTF
jgi:hypothetical protein